MKKTVLYQLNQLGFGGTEKAIYTFIQNMNKEHYEAKIFFYTDFGSFDYYRRKFFALFSKKYKKSFHQKYIINFARRDDFMKLVGKENFYMGSKESFFKLCKREKIDIIHFNRGGSEDFYTQEIEKIPHAIKLVETNIFGKESNENYMNRLSSIFFVSKWLMQKAIWSQKYPSRVVFNPICTPKTAETFRSQFTIPQEAIVLGRISRPNLDDGAFILQVLDRVLNENIYFIIIGATAIFKEQTKNNKQIICIEPTTDEKILSTFYNTLDILLHYRKEGETFGMNIAEAMIHAKPVVSHYSSEDNAQAELLLEEQICGIVVEENSIEQYIQAVETLIENPTLRATYGKSAQQKAQTLYVENVVTKQVANLYDEITKKWRIDETI